MTPDKVWLIILLPFVGFLLNGLAGRRLGYALGSIIGCGTVGLSFILSAWLFLTASDGGATVVEHWVWLEAGPLSIPLAFLVDRLSLVMLLVVTGVGSLIHVYSTGYMKGDPGYHRFFAYLNLFVFFMLILVLGESLALLFVGWEGVGLCSYLLIGYFYEKPSAAAAGLKAFLVNRVGDFGFIVAMLVAFAAFGTLSLTGIVTAAGAQAATGQTLAIYVVTALLFFAATGKSAQIPLYVWLPDAMEGPSPVSALIHAATMVTSGVYLAVRLTGLYVLAPEVLGVVALIGGATAFVAATMGTVERDMKRILAYSTISQLGYMFLAVGAGAAAAGMFHLTTHAFFKACLFLGAGSVMHALGGQIDVDVMGGLRSKMRWTWLTMLAATLAIVGFPLTAGFMSKDGVLWSAWQARGQSLLVTIGLAAGLVTVALTAFYMFRMYFRAFHGTPRDQELHDHAHESPPSMVLVLVILAALALGAGWLNAPPFLKALGVPIESFSHFLEPVVAVEAASAAGHGETVGHGEQAEHGHVKEEVAFSLFALLLGVVGFTPAALAYWRRSDKTAWAERTGALQKFLSEKWYIDQIYNLAFVQGTIGFSRFLWRWIDDVLIDGTVNLVGLGMQVLGEFLRMFQTGLTRNYALWVFLGSLSILLYLVA